MNRGKKLVNLIVNQNNEKRKNADKENQLISNNLTKDPISLIVLKENNCHTETIQNFEELQNIPADESDLIQPEDLFLNSIRDDTTYDENEHIPWEQNIFVHQIEAQNDYNIETNALSATAHELTAYPWTVSGDDSIDTIIATNSTATPSTFTASPNTTTAVCTTTAACTTTATTCASNASLFSAINVPLATSNNTTESIIQETTDTLQRSDTEPNPEQVVVDSDPNNHNMNEGRKRRKTAEPANWKRNLNKRLRMEGKSYTGFRTDDLNKIHQDTPRSNREMKQTCMRDKCIRSKTKKCSEFSQEVRTEIFEKFWSLNWDARKAFVCGHVTKIEKQKSTVTGRDSRRNFTFKYRLSTGRNEENVEVCREMFINTLGVGYRMIQLWINKSSFEMPGPSITRSLVTSNRNAKVDNLQTFLTLLPKMPSHYGRQNSSKLYLEPIFKTIQEVYQLYCRRCNDEGHDPLSRRKFSEVMESENISLFQLKKDQCNICKSHEAKNVTDEKWNEHVRKKELARQNKQQDKDKALAGSQIAIEVDFQAVKLAPFTNANAFYYKTKLACHNYSIYNLQNKQATCYWFSEDQNNQLVASTFVSCLIDYLEKNCLTPEKKDIVIYSDGCTAQNRNNIMSNALLNFSILHDVNIYQKYLEVGHTQMEVDSVHACIERKLKGREIKLPSDYVNVTKEARKNPSPYEVFELEYNFFKDYTQPLRYKTIRPGRNKNDPTVMDIKIIAYSPDGLIKVKLDFDGDYVMLPNRPARHEPVHMYLPLYTERCKISKSKWLHLQDLKSVIARDCHQFYDNLPYKE